MKKEKLKKKKKFKHNRSNSMTNFDFLEKNVSNNNGLKKQEKKITKKFREENLIKKNIIIDLIKSHQKNGDKKTIFFENLEDINKDFLKDSCNLKAFRTNKTFEIVEKKEDLNFLKRRIKTENDLVTIKEMDEFHENSILTVKNNNLASFSSKNDYDDEIKKVKKKCFLKDNKNNKNSESLKNTKIYCEKCLVFQKNNKNYNISEGLKKKKNFCEKCFSFKKDNKNNNKYFLRDITRKKNCDSLNKTNVFNKSNNEKICLIEKNKIFKNSNFRKIERFINKKNVKSSQSLDLLIKKKKVKKISENKREKKNSFFEKTNLINKKKKKTKLSRNSISELLFKKRIRKKTNSLKKGKNNTSINYKKIIKGNYFSKFDFISELDKNHLEKNKNSFFCNTNKNLRISDKKIKPLTNKKYIFSKNNIFKKNEFIANNISKKINNIKSPLKKFSKTKKNKDSEKFFCEKDILKTKKIKNNSNLKKIDFSTLVKKNLDILDIVKTLKLGKISKNLKKKKRTKVFSKKKYFPKSNLKINPRFHKNQIVYSYSSKKLKKQLF